MFNINNKVIDKEGNEGFITHRIGDVYVVNVQKDNMLTANAYRSSELSLKECEFGKDNYCDNVSSLTSCEHCQIMREFGAKL